MTNEEIKKEFIEKFHKDISYGYDKFIADWWLAQLDKAREEGMQLRKDYADIREEALEEARQQARLTLIREIREQIEAKRLGHLGDYEKLAQMIDGGASRDGFNNGIDAVLSLLTKLEK